MTTATYLLTLPANDGTSNQILSTDGGTAIAWATPSTGKNVQLVSSFTGTVATGSTVMAVNNTNPANTAGDQYMSVTITPTSSTNKLRIRAYWVGDVAGAMALYQDSTSPSLAAVACRNAAGSPTNIYRYFSIDYVMTSGTTSATTFKIRAGPSSAVTTTFNGSASTQWYGGTLTSFILVEEYVP